MILERAGRRFRAGGGGRIGPPLDQPPRTWADELRRPASRLVAMVGGTASAGRTLRRSARRSTSSGCASAIRISWRATIDAATRVLRHEFDLLGSGRTRRSIPDRPADADGYRPIDWYLDPVSRPAFSARRPARRHGTSSRCGPAGADIKLPWELARCQHWPLLGQAYRLTGDDRFACEIAHELRDFMEANPVGTASTGPARWTWRCARRTGRSRSS